MKEKASTALWGFRSLGLQMHGVKRWNLNPQVQVRSLEKTRKTWIFQALGNYVRVRSHTQKRQKYLFYSPYTRKTTSFDRNLSFFNDIRSCRNGWYIFDMISTYGGWYMPSAYEGTDIISCLRSKYIIRQKPYIISRSDISFIREFEFIRKTSENIFFVVHSQRITVILIQGCGYFLFVV